MRACGPKIVKVGTLVPRSILSRAFPYNARAMMTQRCAHMKGKVCLKALEASALLCDSANDDVMSEFRSFCKKNLECRELREPNGATIGYDEL